jgi:hypothetical protein
MSAIDQITSLLETLTVDEKMTLIGRIATGKSAKSAKSVKGKKTDDGEVKPKRKAAVGTLAWTAFVKHIKATQPDAFEGIKKESDKLQIVKGIRAEDMAAYDTFVANYKAEHASVEVEAEEAEAEAKEVVEAPAPAPVKTLTAKEKMAAIKAASQAKAAAAPAAAPAPVAAKPAAAKPAKKEVKKAVAKPAKKEEAAQLPTVTIDGENYWHDETTNGLWMKKEGEAYNGADWVGYYQPGNEEEPIRWTDNFGDE